MANTEGETGFVESSQRLVHQADRRWDQRSLRAAATAGELRNTGWPIGVVLDRAPDAPTPTSDGIEARIGVRDAGKPRWNDFWSFRMDGSYYVIRVFEEERYPPSFSSSQGHPERPLWFDIRIWRIVELLLHSATLYGALGIASDEPYLLAINHGGIAGREFWTSTMDYFVHPGRICQTNESHWEREVTIDYVKGNLKPLVIDVVSKLFVLFDFAPTNEETVNAIVARFLGSRV